jgi:general secretion pathway protein M
VRFDLSPITNAYQRLSSRERTLVGLAGGALAVIFVYTMIWQPIEDQRVQLAKRIQTKQHDLIEMQQMRDNYLDLLNQFELREKIIERADPHFSLFPFIESTVSQVLGGRDKIASMNPQNKDISGAYREESVELKLNGVSLQQLVDLMYHIEKGPQPLRLTRLQVKKRPREPQNFDITATVSMLKATEANKAQPAENAPQHGPEKAPESAAPPNKT